MGKQLIAKHPISNVQIIERFIEGTRFIKVTPTQMLPMIKEKLLQQFKGKPINLEVSKTGWIRVEKLERDEEMEKAVSNVAEAKEIDETMVIQKEAQLLEKAGFHVTVVDIK